MKTEWQLLLVAIGGSLGAMSRFGISLWVARISKHSFPWATLIANVAGCFLIGVLIGSGLTEKSQPARLGIGIGYLGALTTFSTFGAETMGHLHRDEWGLAIGNVSANLLIGLAAVFLGMILGKKILG